METTLPSPQRILRWPSIVRVTDFVELLSDSYICETVLRRNPWSSFSLRARKSTSFFSSSIKIQSGSVEDSRPAKMRVYNSLRCWFRSCDTFFGNPFSYFFSSPLSLSLSLSPSFPFFLTLSLFLIPFLFLSFLRLSSLSWSC